MTTRSPLLVPKRSHVFVELFTQAHFLARGVRFGKAAMGNAGSFPSCDEVLDADSDQLPGLVGKKWEQPMILATQERIPEASKLCDDILRDYELSEEEFWRCYVVVLLTIPKYDALFRRMDERAKELRGKKKPRTLL